MLHIRILQVEYHVHMELVVLNDQYICGSMQIIVLNIINLYMTYANNNGLTTLFYLCLYTCDVHSHTKNILIQLMLFACVNRNLHSSLKANIAFMLTCIVHTYYWNHFH